MSTPSSSPTTPTRHSRLSYSVSSTHRSQSSPVLLTPGSYHFDSDQTDQFTYIDNSESDHHLGCHHKSYNPPETPSQIRPTTSNPSYRLLDMPSTPSIASSSGTARSDSSGVLPRPSVDSGIRGQPQGWNDDLSIPLPPVPPIAPGRQSITPQSIPAGRPHPTSSSDQKRSRLESFRDLSSTKAKLAILRDKAFPELVEARRKRNEGNITGAATSQGSSEPNLLSAELSRSPRDGLSTPTQSTSQAQDPGFSTPLLSPYYPTATVTSEESISDLFTTYSKLPPTTPDSVISSQIPTIPSISNRVHIFTSHQAPPDISSSSRGDTHSVISTESSTSTHHRNRVMGIHPDPSRPTISSSGSKRFISQDVNDVLPFASSRLYSAWDLPTESVKPTSVSPVKGKHKVIKNRRTSMSEAMSGKDKFGSNSTGTGSGVVIMPPEEVNLPGWKDLPRPLSGMGQKRIWTGGDGIGIGAYRVGWEREVMDVEARLHDAMCDLAGGKHTFITLDESKEPRTVLDIGTGLGLWPISQALQWQNTHFVGLDAVPCQLDLSTLVRAEKLSRSASNRLPTEEGIWQGVERRVTWDQANFLTTLTYDTGVFDHVHLRFLSLGIPESAWPSLLDEAIRVLAPGGYLEIVELSISLPSSTPASMSRSFSSTLQAEMINPDPSLPIQFALPLLDGLRAGIRGPIFEKSGGGIFDEVGLAWMRSTLEYKGTGMEKAGKETTRRIKDVLVGGKWGWDEKEIVERVEEVRVDKPKVRAWVARKKS